MSSHDFPYTFVVKIFARIVADILKNIYKQTFALFCFSAHID
ncbi:hypothetical protein VFA_002035 [Vibrio furnissii CIP 102972]|nr:hypothetical protein vfu_A02463 [Vibrio furnissii NCTC 11218]EEX42193.1 hypothetical protein VFA_002035 [Vibrio furnissii CIP 102972]